MEDIVTVALHGLSPSTGTPDLPDDPLLVQRAPRDEPAPGTVLDRGEPIRPPSGNAAWPWKRKESSDPPHVDGMIYDHTEYVDGDLHITITELHVPAVTGASAVASDSFSSSAGGGPSFALPAGILSGGVTGTVSVSRDTTYTVETCTRVTVKQPVEYARHFYRNGSQTPDLVITLLHRVKDNGIETRTQPITDCTCRTKRQPPVGITRSHDINPGTTATVNVTHQDNLNLTANAGISVTLPVVGDTSFSLSATGNISRTTSVNVTLPGGYKYDEYDIDGVTYWETR